MTKHVEFLNLLRAVYGHGPLPFGSHSSRKENQRLSRRKQKAAIELGRCVPQATTAATEDFSEYIARKRLMQ